MNRAVAKRLVDQFMKCYEALEEAERVAAEVDVSDEKIETIRRILLVASELEEGLMAPVVQQHPDLNPFSGKRPRTF